MMLAPNIAQGWCDRLADPYLGPATGAVAAVVTRDDIYVASYGQINAERPQTPDEDTLFEIGSITKVFTAILLAKLALAGRIDLDEPIGSIRCEFAGVPDWITPRALSTHTSGLPRSPIPVWMTLFLSADNPYARLDGPYLIERMTCHRPSTMPKPGRPAYSNLGVGLLGYVLGLVAGSGYGTALATEILGPLGLSDTVIELDDNRRRRLATPHGKRGKPTPPWDMDALAGAGALRSTASDLAKFARAVLNAPHDNGPLHRAITKTLEVQVIGRKSFMPDQCLGWIKLNVKDSTCTIYEHQGATRGSQADLMLSPDGNAAYLVLANRGMSLRNTIGIARSDTVGLLNEIAAVARN